jgi:non-heme chloroperoxidase
MANTIFMIHGMWGSPWYWENFRQVFEAKGYRCIATTLPYHDMNPQDAPDPRLGKSSLLDYVDALEKEIRQLDEKPIILGHSMGGLLAQMLGARGLAKKLVLLAPVAPAGILSITPSLIRSSLSIHSTWGFWKKPMRLTFAEASYAILHQLPQNEQKETYSKFVYESGKAACEIFYWFFDSHGAARVDESRVTCPMLVIAGGKDRGAPASIVRRIAKKYQAVSTYKEFENHSHWLMAEAQWREVAEYIVGWLESPKKQR